MKIVIGITGSIAAYKTNTVIRDLVKKGHSVAVILTESGMKFTSLLTLNTFATEGVYTDIFDETIEQPIHIRLAGWADLLLIAPCSLNTISKMSSGIADNLLLATYFAFRGPVMIAPAMNDRMYENQVNRRNLQRVMKDGVIQIPPRYGDLASYDSGRGPMAQPEVIVEEVENHMNYSSDLAGKKVLITVGGTMENIDPVRVISNLSTGSMGYETALAFYRRGAEVTLITSVVRPVPSDIAIIKALSCADFFKAVKAEFSSTGIFISAAAISDFIPVENKQKIKKKDFTGKLAFKKANDILAWVLKNRKKRQKIIGFAAETDLSKNNIEEKMRSKEVDILFVNLISNRSGFGDKPVTGKIISGKRIIEMEGITKAKAGQLLCDLAQG
ncbi:bifunctional phosphopantothenoylcysteine decarboxylase/phosphopantothenate--cysteine ligase CoaBC [bacterium]|nr:bifunctional phosphopantothenoylcysteine decarboxylase/phosphopantothenate--cysteine ligase CoaBC [bacterium]